MHDEQPLVVEGSNNVPSIVYDDTESGSSEDGSMTSAAASSSKKRSKPRTLYSICYPPPKSGGRQKKHRPLLQLHKVTQSSRPRPTFEIIPSSRLSSSLCHDFTKAFCEKKSLSSEDMAIVKAGEYLESTSEGECEEESGHVLAVVCKPRKQDKPANTNGKLLLHDGTEWKVSSLSNGGYEFVGTDHGVPTRIRWFPKRPQGRRTDSATEYHKSSDAESLKLPDALDDSSHATAPAQKSSKSFNCSLISPNTRRHPIVARLSSSMIDIPDSYNIPTPSDPDQEDPERKPKPVTPALRTLVTVTALYISLHEGWCEDFRPAQLAHKASAPQPLRTTTTTTATLAEPVDAAKVAPPPRSPGAFARFFHRRPKEVKEAKIDRPKTSYT